MLTYGEVGTYTGTLPKGKYVIEVYGSGGGGAGFYGFAGDISQSGSAGGLVSETITLTKKTTFTCKVGEGGWESDAYDTMGNMPAAYLGGETSVTIDGQEPISCYGGIPGATNLGDVDGGFSVGNIFESDSASGHDMAWLAGDLESVLSSETGLDATQVYGLGENPTSGGIDGSTTISYYDSIVSADGVKRCFGGAGATNEDECGAAGGGGFIRIYSV